MSKKRESNSMYKQAANRASDVNVASAEPVGRSGLIPALQDMQQRCGYLSAEAIDKLSEATGVSANEIYGVATFYTQFRFSPPGEHTIRVCEGTACHVRGGQQILNEVQQQVKIKAGETTADGTFSLERVACLGCCALAPVVVVDDEVHGSMTVKKISSLLSAYKGGKTRKK
jgi:NADH-quinone oxidoreductase subunit E